MAEEKMGGRIVEWELSCTPEREELPQEEKYDKKTRGPELQKMPEEGEENEKVPESESEKVAEPLPTNKKRIEANKLSPEANTFSRGKVMVNLSHSKLKRKGHTEEKYVPAAKISRKHGKSKLAPEKIASVRTQMLLRLRRSIGLWWKWIKAKKLEAEPSGTATSPYTAMNTALLLKKWK